MVHKSKNQVPVAEVLPKKPYQEDLDYSRVQVQKVQYGMAMNLSALYDVRKETVSCASSFRQII